MKLINGNQIAALVLILTTALGIQANKAVLGAIFADANKHSIILVFAYIFWHLK